MKKICVLIISLFVFEIASAQLLNGGGDFKFVAAYGSDGYETELPGHTNKVNVMIVTTNFFGVAQTSCSYAEYNLVTGMLGGYITFDNYIGKRNGWHVYSWNGNFIFVDDEFERIRVKMAFYNGKYCEYVRYNVNDDIDDVTR
ncbi:MAG: hypothetical protein J5905_06555 [Prevotella sp.]|nr:hypothetical protein [Prevotella sp.]